MHSSAALLDIDENLADYPTTESFEDFRSQVFMATEEYLREAGDAELNTVRPTMTWGNRQ